MLMDRLFILYSCVSIAISLIMAYLFWKRRNSIGALCMSLSMVCEILWSLSYLLSAILTDINAKIFCDSLTFIAAAIIPVIWFIFSIKYTRQEKFNKKIYYYILFIIPSITILMSFTNNLHHLFISEITLEALPNSTFSLLSYKFGFWFWIHAAYSYALLIIGAVMLVIRLINSFRIYRNQAILMIAALFVSFSGDIIYQLGLGPFNNIEITPFTFSIGGILLFIGMFRYRALDLVPIAREAIIETMGDLVIVLDLQNRIIDVNGAARTLFYKQHKKLIGQSVSNILKDIPLLTDGITSNAKSHSEIMMEIDNKKVYYNFEISPLFSKQKTKIGSFIILNDITNLYEAMEKLENAKLLAESASKAKSDFLATMSHEIRTPINGIIGMAELLESAKLLPQERENLKALQYSADSLLNIINEILDFSKIEAGKMEVENESFNLRELISNTAKTFNYHKKIEQIAFSYNIDEQIPANLLGDYHKLRQIMSNLLSNAFKFTEEGEINISVCILQDTGKEVTLSFCVSDTGIGISANEIQNLFQSFHQLDNSSTRKYGGTGLGLSIVKKLIELMGGLIKVESTLGEGSRFCFQLPFKIADNTDETVTLSEACISTEDRLLNILVAEDSKINQMLISQLLQKKNWTVDIAENGKEVLSKLEDNNYNLILMDIQMPEMDGYEAARIIRLKEVFTATHIPIIALTANATQEDRNKCLQYGMDDFLSKPIKSDRLYECIIKHAT